MDRTPVVAPDDPDRDVVEVENEEERGDKRRVVDLNYWWAFGKGLFFFGSLAKYAWMFEVKCQS